MVFIRVTEPMADKYIELFVKRQFAMQDGLNMKQVIIYNNGKLQVFKR
ncbi:MAG: hypothetical protein LBL90_02400 [Prevotellaceae bacterium]|jgi:hypothetical protein|nr:hypothetical protein [Prevotellaceae bacterium]